MCQSECSFILSSLCDFAECRWQQRSETVESPSGTQIHSHMDVSRRMTPNCSTYDINDSGKRKCVSLMTGKITWSHVCFETTKQTQMHQLCPSCSSIVSSHCFGLWVGINTVRMNSKLNSVADYQLLDLNLLKNPSCIRMNSLWAGINPELEYLANYSTYLTNPNFSEDELFLCMLLCSFYLSIFLSSYF
jgi:hypothetical protein